MGKTWFQYKILRVISLRVAFKAMRLAHIPQEVNIGMEK